MHSAKPTYRPEIDGLRAVAVAAVILFHAGIPGFVGGYVGVDVFFVISGFLITTIVAGEIADGRFSLVTFYERRARRILPALFVVIAASTPFAVAIMLPYQLRDFGESVVATILFVPNVLFWLETDYFAPDATLKPLLHTWSLGVEEQFYLIYPLALLGAWRLSPRLLVPMLLVGIAGSLAVAEIGWRISRSAAFFLTPARVWELLAGALVAVVVGAAPAASTPARLAGAAALAGLALILGSIALLSERFPYPSAYTVPPVLGTMLVIAFARPGTLVARLLSVRAVVWVGLVSYSAYLWHQPVFAFAKLHLGTRPGLALSVGLIAATMALAALSHRYVETPFRDRRTGPSRGRVFRLAGAGSLAFAVLGAAFVATDGLVQRYPEEARRLAAVNPTAYGDYTNATFRSLRGAAFDDDPATPNVLLVGDSYARDFVNAAFENGYLAQASISGVNVPAPCGIVLRPGGHEALIEPADRAVCGTVDGLYGAGWRIAQADVVILAASWRDWVIAALPATIEAIEARTDAPVLVVNRKAFGPIEMRRFLTLDPEARRAHRNEMRADVAALNRSLEAAVPADALVDVPRLYCGDPTACPAFTEGGDLVSYDGWHLTPEGAREVGRALFEHPGLAELR